jgi:tripartite-type tricarboxylate transporter receptor subunit TctC
VDAGQVRTLVMWTENRSPRAPNVPTLKELYGIVANSPWGVVGPKGMDPRVVRTLHDAFRRAMDDPVFRKVLEQAGMEAYYQSSEDFALWARRMLEEEGKAVERLGLRPQ